MEPSGRSWKASENTGRFHGILWNITEGDGRQWKVLEEMY
jgi:hypothetical protein